MDLSQNNYSELFHGGQFSPLEEMLVVKPENRKLVIGVPRECAFLENRISLVPDAVALLVQHGHHIMIETDAGKAAHFTDHEFSEMGAEIVYDTRKVFSAEIILKVAPITAEETEMLGNKQALISSLHTSGITEEYFRRLLNKRTTSIAFEFIQDKAGTFPVIRAMSEIAGNTSMLVAAEYMSHPEYGRGKMLGGFSGISPTEVVILGAGTVGEYAARAALGMGAFVKIFDNSVYKLRRLQNNLNTRVYTSMLHPRSLLAALQTADVVIGAVHSAYGRTPCIVSEDMVSQMKEGAVIIDVSIDQGGCFETSRLTDHKNPVFKKYGVTHYCVPNIPSKVPNTASYAFSNFLTPILLDIGEKGGIENALRSDFGVRQGVYLFNGTCTNKFLSDSYHLPFQDINLLMAAFH
ncbi:MAG: alanine dehydrogenase [Bacteroidetes bacterium]|nr:alanine dehydrogenase [Bacteroidota bacterium]